MKATLDPPANPDSFEIPPITDRQRELLLRHWKSTAETLMERDGKNPAFANGGHRIKSNPLLTAAIEEIRDEYFTLFNEKQKLLAEREKAQNIDSTDKSWDTRIGDVDYDLIALNQKGFFRLQQPNYGFSDKRRAEILAERPDPVANDSYQLNKTDAAKIMGTIIKRAILAFEIQFKPRVWVPHVPLKSSPEETSHFRSRPRARSADEASGRDEGSFPSR